MTHLLSSLRLGAILSLVATLALVAGGASPSLAASNDDNVQWNELGHDSRSSAYRTPQGAAPTGTEVTLRLRAASGDLTAARVRVWNDRLDQQTIYDMERVAADVVEDGTAYEYWEVTLPPSSDPTIYWYRFIVVDGSDTDYYEDDERRTGGWGQAYDESVDRSWQLTFYDDQYSTPDWIKNAVVYQIFPDRFRDGDSSNNPGVGEFFYGNFDTIVRSNDGQGHWNARICDPRDRPGSTSTCEGKYSQNFYGGDLQGIIDKLDYIDDLGVTAIYLNPIFESPSNHKYDTTNFFKIDDNFGDLSTFQTLISEAHSRGIKVILDGVFNHSSSDSYYFDRYDRWNGDAPGPSDPAGGPVTPGSSNDSGACETTDGTVSTYLDWYTFFPYEGTGNAPCSDNRDYPKWFGIFDSLPVMQHDNPEVRDYFINQGTNSVGPYWIGQGADGWRLDVAPEIDHGQVNEPSDDYWEDFRDAVHAENPDTYIVGEEWGNATSWTVGGEWDATMNYQFASAILSFWRDETFTDNDFNSGSSAGELQPLTPSEVNDRLMHLKERYAPEAFQAMMNLFNSHDTNRALFLLDHNGGSTDTGLYNDPSYDWSDAIQRLKGATIMQMTLPGAPTIYYGDEVGTVNPPAYDGSQWQDDPYNRVPYPWTDESGTPYYSHMPDNNLLSHYQSLTSIRNQSSSLRTGSFEALLTDDDADVYGYGRKMDDDSDVSVVAVNGSSTSKSVTIDVAGYLPAGASLTDALNGGSNTVSASGEVSVTVPARSGVILRGSDFSGQRPECVSDLTASAASGAVDLSWSATTNGDTYLVYRSRIEGGGYEEIASVSGTNYSDTSVENATEYHYTVVAQNSTTLLESGVCGNEVSATPALTIDWANLQFPPTIAHVISATDSTDTIYGQLYIAGATDADDTPVSGVTAQVGFGPAGTAPSSSDWTWFDMRPNPGFDFAQNNDEYLGKMLPTETGTFKFTTRWSTDGGQSWTYTDQVGPPYDESDAGDLTVSASDDTTPPSAPTGVAVPYRSDSEIRIAWDTHPNADGDVAGFRVYRENDASPGFSEVGDVSGASSTSFTDDTVTSGETYNYYVTAYDANLNESSASSTVQAVAEALEVDVTFRVTVPDHTPETYPVHIAGNLQDPQWTPGDPDWQLTEVDETTWEITKTLVDGAQHEYKYVRGDWPRVEKEADGATEVDNRPLTVDYGSDGTQLVEDTVANWRDPYVIAATPQDGASDLIGDQVSVELTWNQSMPAEPTGFDLTGPNGTVSGTWSYDDPTFTHTFTPDAPLNVGTYTATASGVQDAHGDVQSVGYTATWAVGALPVELTGFGATFENDTEDVVTVQWETASETNSASFTVQRSVDEGETFADVGSVRAAGTSVETKTYRLVDENPPFTATTLTYRLKQVDTDGSVQFSKAITVDRAAPDEYVLHGSFPNPASDQTTLRYALPESGDVTIAVFDVLGRKVASIVDGQQELGRKQIQVETSRLASGSYFVRMNAGGKTLTQRLTVVR